MDGVSYTNFPLLPLKSLNRKPNMSHKLEKTLLDISLVGQSIAQTLSEIDDLNALPDSWYTNTSRFFCWHNGPYSKGHFQSNHADVNSIEGSGHTQIKFQTLNHDLKKNEKKFEKLVKKLSKILAKSPICKTTKTYPALSFRISHRISTVQIEMCKDFPNPGSQSSPEFELDKHWAEFTHVCYTILNSMTFGKGQSWNVDNVFDKETSNQIFLEKKSFTVKTPCAESALNYVASLWRQEVLIHHKTQLEVTKTVPAQMPKIILFTGQNWAKLKADEPNF